MKVTEVIDIITAHGGERIRMRGDHRFYRVELDGVVGHTTVSGKLSDQVPVGLINKMDRDLAPVLGKGWLK